MDSSLVWLVLGIVLIIVELTTGTLYLLFLGLAGIAAAIAAWMGAGFGWQAATFAVFALVSVFGVQHYRKGKGAARPMAALEAGQPVTFEAWIDRDRHLARVRFRGTLWDAQVAGDCKGEAGEVLYVKAVVGSMLTIARAS
ncbi:MAG: hypothetical protein ABIU95_05005 [Burkholderiales bacterium]